MQPGYLWEWMLPVEGYYATSLGVVERIYVRLATVNQPGRPFQAGVFTAPTYSFPGELDTRAVNPAQPRAGTRRVWAHSKGGSGWHENNSSDLLVPGEPGNTSQSVKSVAGHSLRGISRHDQRVSPVQEWTL
jgi:hypothetical protein